MSELWNKLKSQFEEKDDEDMMEEEEVPQAVSNPGAVPVAPRPAAVRGIGYAAVPARQAKPYTMVVVNPTSYKDAEKIGSHLKQSRPVVLNLEKTDSNEAMRIVDFVNGIMYALDGRIDQISENIYLCAPNNMSVDKENYAAYAAPMSGMDADKTLQWKVPQA